MKEAGKREEEEGASPLLEKGGRKKNR